jgi:hypothetical protein
MRKFSLEVASVYRACLVVSNVVVDPEKKSYTVETHKINDLAIGSNFIELNNYLDSLDKSKIILTTVMYYNSYGAPFSVSIAEKVI